MQVLVQTCPEQSCVVFDAGNLCKKKTVQKTFWSLFKCQVS